MHPHTLRGFEAEAPDGAPPEPHEGAPRSDAAGRAEGPVPRNRRHTLERSPILRSRHRLL